jgi:subtilisin family serine protease
MKNSIKALALAVALACNTVGAQTAADVAKFQTPEYWSSPSKSDDLLNAIHAEYAYARGWTGKGVVVGVIDTGVNMQNPDLIGRVKMFYDPLKLGNNDVVGHGTHVAGIIAANKNNYGMQGVAYDAQLIVVKVTNTTAFPTSVALSGMNFAVMNGATVINWSAGVTFDAGYNRDMTQVSPGVFTNSSPVFGGKNYYGLESPTAYATALGPNAVMVVAAGNSGLKYPENPASFATAVDSTGKLILGGRMLIVGNYDLANNRMSASSNLAGHVCKDYVNNTCRDPYRTSDFYLVAPGTNITSTYGTGYAMMSGTSMAAPVVSGSVAVLRQMWPYLRGDAIAKILLTTANKNLPNYDVNVYGQGMVDLERATRPVGTISVPVSANVQSAGLPMGGITVNTGTAKLSGVTTAVMDDFNRVYFTTLAPVERAKTRAAMWDPVSAGTALVSGSNLGMAGSQMAFRSNTVNDLSVTTGTTADNRKSYFETEYNFSGVTAGLGNLTESDAWLSNTSSGSFGTFDGTNTNIVYLGHRGSVGAVDYRVRYSAGASQIQHTDTLFSQLPGSSRSRGWQFQAQTRVDATTLVSVGVQQPLAVTQAQMSLRTPVSSDEEGNLTYQRVTANMAAERRQIDAYGYINTSIDTKSSVYLFANYSRNYLNQPGVQAAQAGIVFDRKF